MTTSNDPFVHHPELRDKISDPSTSFFRDFKPVEVFKQWPELSWVIEKLYSEDFRQASRRDTLSNHKGGDFWIFAYGSLMWDPAFNFNEVRRARVSDHARRFILKDVWGGRGTRESPGLMAALDGGNGCDGLIYRISDHNIGAETENLWRREMIGPGYIPKFVDAKTENGSVRALTFVADYDAENIQPSLKHEEQIEYLVSGEGVLGTSMEYLENIVSQFDALGIVDEECSNLLAATRTKSNAGLTGSSGAGT